MTQIVESFLAFLSSVGQITFQWLVVLLFVSSTVWVTLRILRGEGLFPIGGCLGWVVKYGGFLFLCTSLGAYFGDWLRSVLFDIVWIQAFFALVGLAIGGFVLISLAGRKE
ncbi:MAG TPA: hypothetical protein EYP90_02090 [Chromatiaceae bacterium]|nr:hypothetical protein [Chromatiaceae bacterium]